MEYSAILHDMDKRFCYAIDKDLFVLRVQVKKADINEIILHYEDKYIPLERKDTRERLSECRYKRAGADRGRDTLVSGGELFQSILSAAFRDIRKFKIIAETYQMHLKLCLIIVMKL